MKVLVTAFLPFNNSINNYSQEVIKFIENVDKEILDVVYDKSYQTLEDKYNLNEYDLIIAMGEARMRDVLTLETQAINISSCSLKDNAGNLKQNETIIIDSESIIKTEVNIEKVKDLITFSNDAGKFVCNNIYYHLLSNYKSKSIFIHIPHCNDNTEKYIEHAATIQKIINKLI